MTVVKGLSTALLVLRESAQESAGAERERLDRFVIPSATVVFLATAAVMLAIDWRVGVPVMVALSIAAVTVAKLAVSAEPVVDDEEFAFDRLEATDEPARSTPPAFVEAGWASLVELTRPVAAAIARARRSLAPSTRR